MREESEEIALPFGSGGAKPRLNSFLIIGGVAPSHNQLLRTDRKISV